MIQNISTVLWWMSLFSFVSAQQFDIPTTLDDLGVFNVLVEFLEDVDLDESLSSDNGEFTLFAPTDDAFALLPPDFVDCLRDSDQSETLANLLLYHAISGSVLAANLGTSRTALNSETLTFSTSNGITIINGVSNIIFPNEVASNGRIHAIDTVLIPPNIDISAVTASCSNDESSPPLAMRDIPATFASTENLVTLSTVLVAANMNGILAEPNGPFTVFAPSEDAFEGLPQGFLTCLLKPENIATLSNILTYHVLMGSSLSTDFVNGATLITLAGENITIGVSDDEIFINQFIGVADADIEASNGVIHVIDELLVPPKFNYSTFIATCDILATEEPSLFLGDIFTILEERGGFDMLLNALDTADLDITLTSETSQFTLFAPDDAAFAALPDTFLPCLLLPENTATLDMILSYHLIDGSVLKADLPEQLTTLNGEPISITFDTNSTIINGYAVVQGVDLEASNGVIYVVDAVLLPPIINVTEFLGACVVDPPTASPTITPGAGPTITPGAGPTITPSTGSIMATIATTANFETLSSVLNGTSLSMTSNATYTVFAPTETAFAALPEGLISCLLLPTNSDALTSLLEYHIISGTVESGALFDGMTLPTVLSDGNLTISVFSTDGTITVNRDATVVQADIVATNGIIHAIDSILVPASVDLNAIGADCQTSPSPPASVAEAVKGDAVALGALATLSLLFL